MSGCKGAAVKRFSFDLDAYQAQRLFSPIRDKRGSISLWMNSMKIMSVNAPSPRNVAATLSLVVSKMSRLFLCSETKVFSLNFPFHVYDQEGSIGFRSRNCADIDSRVTSEILSLVDSFQVLEKSDVYGFSEPIMDSCEVCPDSWLLLRDLMLCEDGYLRYDNDLARANGHLHPRHHVDFFYTGSSTLKVGSAAQFEVDDLVNLCDVNTECLYFVPSKNIGALESEGT